MPNKYTFIQKALAFSVHVFTASGIIAAIMAIIAISDAPQVGVIKYREAMIWLFVALVIDGIDGTFARRFKVTEVLPNWSGKNMDYVIDFATYAIIPAFFIYQSELLPDSVELIGIFSILMVSALYYGKEGMVSDKLYFVGFPVMWNMVAFGMYFITDYSQWVNFFYVILFSVLHFVPIKYPYPSHPNKAMYLTIAMSIIFFVVSGIILYIFPQKIPWLNHTSFATIIGFGIVSLYVTFFEND